MPAIRDKKRNTWIAQFYYEDCNGMRKRKRKRGFKTKREAQAFEREFLTVYTNDKTQTFGYIVEIYLNDIKHRIKESTLDLKTFIINEKILPYFKDKRISEIKPRDIREWENLMLSKENNNGKGYKNTYLKTLFCQLNAIFNYAVRYWDLKENPCKIAGSIGKTNAEEKNIWTLEEFNIFLRTFDNRNSVQRLAFLTLFYTGIRMGELLALMPEDINKYSRTLSIRKTFQRIKGKDVFTEPKTQKSIRDITLPTFLYNLLVENIKERKLGKKDRIFDFTSQALNYTLRTYTQKAGLKKIRPHDFRHSHASLLINIGTEASLVADRLGHESIETTLNIYTHLYPKEREKIAEKLNDLEPIW